ncbi:class I SAM-dependent DNA methyltransferase [Streptomyces sp. 7N604]|uniref:class I SAM-dependent DNA methyltransferase n=1 Tax=Streptomyces sp. 7N604 TaxID=3457415 RepID=UPI003FD632D6
MKTEPDFLSTTRAFHDAVATDYAERFRDELAAWPLARAMLAAFAELVQAAGAGPVADLGCGPGRLAAHLHALGLSVFGVDLSPQMIALAQQAHSGLRFEEGSMTALNLPDGALGGADRAGPHVRQAASTSREGRLPSSGSVGDVRRPHPPRCRPSLPCPQVLSCLRNSTLRAPVTGNSVG